MAWTRELAVFLSLLAVVTCQDGEPNPYLAPFGLGLQYPRPLSLTGCNAPTYLVVGNSGPVAAENVDVTLSTADWGISFGEWTEVGKATVTVGPESEETVEFPITLESESLTCLQARIVGGEDNEASGETSASTGGARSTQSSQEFLYAMDVDSYLIPVRTGLDGDSLTIRGTKFGCVMADGSTKTTTVDGPGSFSMSCGGNEISFEMPDLEENGTVVLPAGSEIFGKLSIKFGDSGEELKSYFETGDTPTDGRGATTGEGWQWSDRVDGLVAASGAADVVVMVETSDGEQSSVVLRFVKTSVEELLNTPYLCDIKSVKTRVLLETELAAALTAYEQGQDLAALAHIIRFMDRAERSKCDLECDETPALEHALLAAGDAARMISYKGFIGPEAINEQVKLSSDEHRRTRSHRARAHRHRRHLVRH